MTYLLRKAVISVAILLLFPLCPTAWADTIDPDNNGSHYAWGENVGWINLKPAFGPGVTVTSTSLSGYAWGENIGWINLNPAFGGVLNDTFGNLSGYAWAEKVGWIKFDGVSIDACGDFNGKAWGENIGWISFRADGNHWFRVHTSWSSPLDTIPPSTTYYPDTKPWYQSDTSFHLVATDCGSGVKELHYIINGNETVVNGATATVTLTNEGCYNVYFHSIDNAGNVEADHLLKTCIDRTPPVITMTVPADSATYSINSQPAPIYTVTDSVSGVSATTGGVFSTSQAGSYSYTVTATDNAGNSSSVTHNYTVTFPGNVDPGDTGCQYAWAENVGWINFKPSWGPGVTVTNTAVTGMVWGENIGWVNLSPAFGGVVNDISGNLSGYAWGENVGWINFRPTGGGVAIGADGKFSGYAWGENIGWINFSAANSCVKTSWVPPPKTYTVTLIAGPNGSISGPTTVNDGGKPTYSITPNSGYHVFDVTVGGISVGAVTSYTFPTGITAPMTIAASFAINSYTLTYTAGANGSISGTTPQTVNYGANGTTVTAVPAIGYHFVSWSDGVTTAARTDANVTGNISVTASFAINTFTLTYIAGTNGSISGTTPQTVNYGGSTTAVTANPDPGYYFVNWTDSGNNVVSNTNPLTLTNVIANASLTANFAVNQTVIFPDPGLDAAIRSAIHKPTGDIYLTDLQNLTNFNAQQKNISNLQGLQYCSALRQLSLDINQISDISPLSGMINLTYLGLNTNQISNISPLANLVNLTSLNLDSNQISDISPLANLANLASLSLGANKISDISPLANLTNLRTLNLLNNNRISNISPLANLVNLTNINLGYNQISNISPLSGLVNLTSLDLHNNNQVSDISPLAGMSKLTYLDLSTNQISNISPLAAMVNLTTLSLGANKISDISLLATLVNLTYLNLYNNQISTISSLANMVNLTSLNLGYNQISNISPMGNLVNLKSIYLYINQISDISPLANLVNLTSLYLYSNQISDISPLAGMSKITILYLNINHISDISALVTNQGIGSGDIVNVSSNYLNTNPGSQNMSDIQTLISRGVQVTYTPQNTYTLVTNVIGQGTINSVPSGTSFSPGTTIQLTAVPSNGWNFTGWSGGLTGNTNPTTLTIDGNKTVTATFAINTYTLTYTAGANGTISGTTPQTVNYGTSGTQVTAIANTGYHFVSWSDGVTTAARTDTNVTGNISVTASFTINTYTLTYTAGANGSISGTTPQNVNYGGSGTQVTAVANSGYHFVSWSDGVTTAARTDTNVTANISVTASFALKNQYTLTFTAGAGGAISGASPQYVLQGGSSTPVTALPDTGYHFANWTGDNGFVTKTANPLTVNNVAASQNITANFAINQYTITFVAGPHGSISGTTKQTVNYGDSTTSVTAVPNTGYNFVNWTDTNSNVVSSSATLTLTNVTATQKITANFAPNQYTLNFTASAGGAISGTSPQYVLYGDNATPVTAVPNTGYYFVNWTGDNGFVTKTANPLTLNNVKASQNITANFAINQYIITFVAGLHGSISGTTKQTVNYGDSTTSVTAVPNTGYNFVNWTDTNSNVVSSSATLMLTNVMASQRITANFAPNQYTLTFTAGAGGAISGASPQFVLYGDNTTPVTALPNTGYHFVNWTGNNGFVTKTANPLTVNNVKASQNITANFAINQYTITFVAGLHGSISGTTKQTVNYGDSTTSVTAVPNTGYYFVNWTDTNGNVVSSSATFTLTNVMASQRITANFSK